LCSNRVQLTPFSLPSWNFEITAGHNIDATRYPPLVRFSSNVNFLLETALKPFSTGKFISWLPVAGIQVLSFQQKITSQFLLIDTPYTCDVDRFQNFNLTPKAPKTSQSIGTYARDGQFQWSISVHQPEWDTLLALNAELGIGEGVKLKVDERALFGWDGGDAYELLLEKLDQLAKLTVRGAEHVGL